MSTDARLNTLESTMAELAAAQLRSSANLDRLAATVERTSADVARLSDEMRAFKDEMRSFKGEMLSFKGEMLLFKDEMGAFKDEMRVFKDEMGAFKDEMRVFKDEMGAFKDEMGAFKDEMAAFKDETRASNDEMRAWNKEARKQWGELANKMGTMAEDIVAPGIPEMFRRLFGVEDPDWYVRVRRRHRAEPSRRVEFDVVAWGGGYFLATEVRSNARPEDLRALLSRLAEVRDFFPEAEGSKVVGALASYHVDASLVRAAEREGLLVFGLSGGLLELLSPPGLKLREY